MKIGILSDTHGHLPAFAHTALDKVDLIFHAGDIGKQDIITELETIAPVKAVHGNIDGWPLHDLYPVTIETELEGVKFCITHHIVTYQYFTFDLFRKGKKPDVVVFGHTHKAVCETYRGILFINPGSVYRPKGGTRKSLAVIRDLRRQLEPEFIYWD